LLREPERRFSEKKVNNSYYNKFKSYFKPKKSCFEEDNGEDWFRTKVPKKKVRIIETPVGNVPNQSMKIENNDKLFENQKKVSKFSNNKLASKDIISKQEQISFGLPQSHYKSRSPSRAYPPMKSAMKRDQKSYKKLKVVKKSSINNIIQNSYTQHSNKKNEKTFIRRYCVQDASKHSDHKFAVKSHIKSTNFPASNSKTPILNNSLGKIKQKHNIAKLEERIGLVLKKSKSDEEYNISCMVPSIQSSKSRSHNRKTPQGKYC